MASLIPETDMTTENHHNDVNRPANTGFDVDLAIGPEAQPHDTDIRLNRLAALFDRLLSAETLSGPSLGVPAMSTRLTLEEIDAIAERNIFDAVERGDRQMRRWLNSRVIGHDMALLGPALARAGRDMPPEEWVRRYLRPDEPEATPTGRKRPVTVRRPRSR